MQINKITWSEYGSIVDMLAMLVKEYSRREGIKFGKVCGIARGGLIPGVSLSHALGIPFVTLSKIPGSADFYQSKDAADGHVYEYAGIDVALHFALRFYFSHR